MCEEDAQNSLHGHEKTRPILDESKHEAHISTNGDDEGLH